MVDLDAIRNTVRFTNVNLGYVDFLEIYDKNMQVFIQIPAIFLVSFLTKNSKISQICEFTEIKQKMINLDAIKNKPRFTNLGLVCIDMF